MNVLNYKQHTCLCFEGRLQMLDDTIEWNNVETYIHQDPQKGKIIRFFCEGVIH
jgi:hypothetical protein